MAFVKEMWPEFIEGRHHKEIADKFDQIAQGKIKRLISYSHNKISALCPLRLWSLHIESQ